MRVRTKGTKTAAGFIAANILVAIFVAQAEADRTSFYAPTSVETTSKADFPGIKIDTLEAIRRQGAIIDPVGDTNASKQAIIAQAEAVAIASKSFGFKGADTPSSASLVDLTVTDYGQETQPNLTKASKIEPAIAGRLTWVVVFNNVRIPLMAYHPSENAEDTENYYRAPLYVAIDAQSGEFLSAESL